MKGQDLIDKLERLMQAPSTEAAQANGHAAPRSTSTGDDVADDVIIEDCRRAKNAPKFEALFDHGDTSAYGRDASDADFALLGILKFETQDPDQLERLMRRSALARPKWNDGRAGKTWLRYSIDNALEDVREARDRSRRGSRPLGNKQGGTAAPPYIESAARATADEEASSLRVVRFAGRPAPKPREFVIPNLIPRYHPTTLYGWGGTAKSLIAVLLAMNVAGGRKTLVDREITVHGPALYVDFELDADEQHRRVAQLAAGLGIGVPQDLLYVSALGVRTHEAIDYALSVCEEHGVVLAVLDSLGPAMVGDMAAARDVIEFHNCYIAPFRGAGVTPILIDHQARQQAGEGYQSKGAFGSAYKEHLSRSLIQVEAGDRNAEQGTLNVRLRHKKTNFGALCDPFDVSLRFSDEEITVSVRELVPSDRAQETTLNSKDRVAAALEDGPAYPDELVDTTGLTRGTIKNAITALKKAGRVEVTGEIQGKMERVRLVAPAARPIKGSAASATPDTSTVARLFADPPDWLAKELPIYRKAPERHIKALCTHVAAVVLGDGLRGDEVREEVERELGQGS